MAGSTPIYGFPYPQSTDLVADYPTLGQELATDVETVISGLGSGLNIMTPTSIANSGGTASASGGQVTFTGVSSLSLNGIFTTNFDNYEVVITVTGSTSADVAFRMRVAGVDSSTGYDRQVIQVDGGTVSTSRSTGNTSGFVGYMSTVESGGFVMMYGPKLAKATIMLSDYFRSTNGTFIEKDAIRHTVATAYDGLTIFPPTGTMTGIVRVYGLKNS